MTFSDGRILFYAQKINLPWEVVLRPFAYATLKRTITGINFTLFAENCISSDAGHFTCMAGEAFQTEIDVE